MRWIYLLFSNYFFKIIFFTSSTWGNATRGLFHFYTKSSKIQSFKRLHHHEVRTLGLKFRSRKEGLIRREVDFIVLVLFFWFHCECCDYGFLIKVMGNNKNKDKHLGVIRGGVVKSAKVAKWQQCSQSWRREIDKIA
jgi:hypothetical protein